MNLNCDISTLKTRYKRNLQFNNENALVMKRLQLDVDQLDQLMDEELSFTTRGNGIGFMSVKLKYNVILPEKLCKFEMNVELKEWRYIDQKKKGQKRKSTNVLEDKNKNVPDLEMEEDVDDEFDSEEDGSLSDSNEFEKMFGKDLLKELENEFTSSKRTKRTIKRTKRNSNEARSSIEKEVKASEDKQKPSTKIDKKEIEKLMAKDDLMEEIILKKIDHHFELEEDNSQFHYEIENKRQKRSILTRFIGRKRSDTSSSKKNLVNKGKKTTSASISEENIRIINDNDNNSISPRTVIDDGSFAVYKLKICAQHIPNFDSDMTIIEIGLLTGFEIDKDDLQSKVFDPKVSNQSTSFTQLSKVEVTGRTVILYLDSVSHGKPDCYTLKLYQISQVANLQSGMVKIYDYYRKDDPCTTLYSPAIIEHLNITCENKACTCSVNSNCPDNKRIYDIIQISEHDYPQGKDKFQDLVCFDKKLSHVFIGRVVDYKLLSTNLLFKIETVRKYREKGPQITKTVVLVFNQECTGKLDIKISNEPYIFFLNGTNYIAKGENQDNILTIYPTRRSMIYSLSKQLNTGAQNNIDKYLNDINKYISKGILDCNESTYL